jgi:hypothetical protein
MCVGLAELSPLARPLALPPQVAGKDESALRRLLSESEDIAMQRTAVSKKLELLQRAAQEIAMFR